MRSMSFEIAKSFGRLYLDPSSSSLRLRYVPMEDGELNENSIGACDIAIDIEDVGNLWATTRAFLYGVESLDLNIIIRPAEESDSEVLVKLYRDKPKGAQGALSGEETCWLRIVSGRSEEERRRIKLGPRDLLSIELACNAVLVMSASPIYNSAATANGHLALASTKATKKAATKKVVNVDVDAEEESTAKTTTIREARFSIS
ncbi:hypothetical protein JNK13_10415 [bacterium]|nr:hypothetical protein [bacterium]